MEKEKRPFEDFFAEVDPDYKEFVTSIHERLLRDGYRLKVVWKTGGFFVSYTHPKTRRSLLNFLYRKKDLLVRIYGDHCDMYADFINGLPVEMEEEIAGNSVCKRMTNPEAYQSKCAKGYDFFIRGTHYQKCRYRCFQFKVTAQSIPVLLDFLDRERKERRMG